MHQSAKKIKLEHIALAAGVSKITVSRALSNPEKVKPETRIKILKTADDMGYFNHPLSKISNEPSRKLIGIVNPNMRNPFFGNLAKLMTEISKELNYDILIFDSFESEALEANSIQNMVKYGVNAIILSVISSDKNYNPDYLSMLKNLNIPVILIDREIGNSEYSGIYIDNIHCGVEAAKYVNSCKNNDVVVVAGPEHSNVSNERIKGVLSEINPKKNLQIFNADFDKKEAYKVTKNFLKHNTKKISFIGINNQISLGILQACIEKGMVFTQDFNLFSVDKVPHADIFGFKIPCISHNLQEIAYQAISIAMRSIEKPNNKINRIIIRGKVSQTN